MAMDDAPESHAAIRALASYLRVRPNACDTADGIRRWWLPDGLAPTADELEKALTWMKQQGLIDETVAADGRVRYRRCASDAQLEAAAAQPD